MNIPRILLLASALLPVLPAGAAAGTPAANTQGAELCELARHHLNGTGVEKNIAQAKSLLQQAAQKQHRPAQLLLAKLCMEGEEPDFPEAARWLRQYRSVEKDAESAWLLSQCCTQQYEDIGATEQEGEELLQEAAHGGWPTAQFALGLQYEYGYRREADPDLAVQWYRKAAARGNAEALHNLAAFYEKSEGFPADVQKALRTLKADKAMFTQSCMCDPDPFCASEELEKNISLCASGKMKLADYSACLVDLLEGYPARFNAEPGEVVGANEALTHALVTLMAAGAPVNGCGTRLMNATASCHRVLITPLHCAADMGDLDLARLLLAAGADPRAKTRIGDDGCDDECTAADKGKTPLDFAHSPEMKTLLRQHIEGKHAAGTP